MALGALPGNVAWAAPGTKVAVREDISRGSGPPERTSWSGNSGHGQEYAP
jgi:hypothetical protein